MHRRWRWNIIATAPTHMKTLAKRTPFVLNGLEISMEERDNLFEEYPPCPKDLMIMLDQEIILRALLGRGGMFS